MPYKTSWKDGKPIRNNEAPDPLKKNNNYIENGPQCEACKLPHMSEKFLVERNILEEETHLGDVQETINKLSSEPFWGEDDSSEEEYIPYVYTKRIRQQYTQQVLFDNDENLIMRLSTKEERRAHKLLVVEQARSNYKEREL